VTNFRCSRHLSAGGVVVEASCGGGSGRFVVVNDSRRLNSLPELEKKDTLIDQFYSSVIVF
jgi:hypothetical protein